MKFSRFAQGSILTEVFTKLDWNYFNAAYGIGETEASRLTPAGKAKRGRARKWIIDVLEVFALKLDIDISQAKMVFERPDMPALRRIYTKRQDALRAELRYYVQHDMLNSKPAAELEERIKQVTKFVEMASEDLANMVRAEWLRALSLPHPAFERHLISGKSNVRQSEGSDAKVQGKRGTTPIVEHKNMRQPKAA